MSLHDPHPLLVLVFFLLHLVFGLSRVPQESPQSLRETGDWRAQGELDRDKKPSRRIKKWPIRSGTAALPRVCVKGAHRRKIKSWQIGCHGRAKLQFPRARFHTAAVSSSMCRQNSQMGGVYSQMGGVSAKLRPWS